MLNQILHEVLKFIQRMSGSCRSGIPHARFNSLRDRTDYPYPPYKSSSLAQSEARCGNPSIASPLPLLIFDMLQLNYIFGFVLPVYAKTVLVTGQVGSGGTLC